MTAAARGFEPDTCFYMQSAPHGYAACMGASDECQQGV